MTVAYLCVQGRRRRIRREGIVRDYDNPLDNLHDQSIVSKYRLTRQMIHNICALLKNDLHRPTTKPRSLPLRIQIMAALSLNMPVEVFKRSLQISTIFQDKADALILRCYKLLSWNFQTLHKYTS